MVVVGVVVVMFQSAPRSVERGDANGYRPQRTATKVSIRAPLSRAGRRTAPHVVAHYCQRFQSAPRSVERGDVNLDGKEDGIACFNPRPAQSSGATTAGGETLPTRSGFNPRPAQSSGATDS